jgi:hypothetical protein
MQPSATVSVFRATLNRDAINRANAEHSTGPRTEAGKQRSSLNALRHGLTAKTAVLPSEDPAAYEQHCRQFRDEYQPANSTETQLVQELADTAWRLNRIPLLEAGLFDETASSDFTPQTAIQAIATLGLHSARLSRQFQRALDQLRQIQYDRRHQERRDLRDAAELLELHKHKGLPWEPSDHGFVFSKEQVERHSERLMRQNEAYHIGNVRFDIAPQLLRRQIANAF